MDELRDMIKEKNPNGLAFKLYKINVNVSDDDDDDCRIIGKIPRGVYKFNRPKQELFRSFDISENLEESDLPKEANRILVELPTGESINSGAH